MAVSLRNPPESWHDYLKWYAAPNSDVGVSEALLGAS
jgi:hypothetical protein